MYQWNPALLAAAKDADAATWIMQYTLTSMHKDIVFASARPSVMMFRYSNLDINGDFPKLPCK